MPITAENVHVRIQFQAQGSVAEKIPKPPKDPEDEPGPYEKYIEDIVPPAIHMAELAGKRARLEMLMTGEDSTHSAEISIGQARQEYTTALIPLYLVFVCDDLANSFNIKWEIRASNLGATVRGQINVKVEKTVKDVDAGAPKVYKPQPLMN